MKYSSTIATPHYRQGVTSLVLLSVLLAGLIAYKIGPALRNIGVARATGSLTLRPYLAQPADQSALKLVGKESYLRIIWPALVFAILIAAAVRMAISPEWFARFAGTAGWRGAVSGAAAGAPLMQCSCCAAPVFEGLYERTHRLDASLALMLAAPSAVLVHSNSPFLAALVVRAALLLPVPTLFEIPIGCSLFVADVPAGIIAAVLFAAPLVNLPPLLVVGRAAGARIAMTLGLYLWLVAIAIGLAMPH